jgi:hypothetical protein
VINAEPGTEIEFEKVPSAFTKEFFMLAFDGKEKDGLRRPRLPPGGQLREGRRINDSPTTGLRRSGIL